MTEGIYYPPSESEGGWRSLISPNDAPTTGEKQKIIQTTGLDWDKLHEAWKYCESFNGLDSLLVIRHGWIAGEWHNFTQPKGIASCTKSLTGLAMAKLFDLSDAGKLTKHIDIDDEAWQFLPSKWIEAEPERRYIKIRNMLTMTSGLTPYDGPYEADYEEKVFAQTVESPPGTIWAYASVPVDMLSLVIENVFGQKMGDFFNHTWSLAIYEYRVNGKSIGELGMAVYYAAALVELANTVTVEIDMISPTRSLWKAGWICH